MFGLGQDIDEVDLPLILIWIEDAVKTTRIKA